VQIVSVLHPAVLLAFADGTGFVQHRDRPPRNVRIAGRRSLNISIEVAPGRDESDGPSPVSGTEQGFEIAGRAACPRVPARCAQCQPVCSSSVLSAGKAAPFADEGACGNCILR